MGKRSSQKSESILLSFLSPFVDTFFQTFTPKDTAIGISPLADKSDMYLEALENQDSILLESSKYIDFDDEHFEKVKKLFLEKEFEEDWAFLKDKLLREIRYMDYKVTGAFLEKLYYDSYENSAYQVSILRKLIAQKTKESNAKMLKMMEDDTPISDDGGSFLWGLTDSSELAKPMMKKLLEFSTIPDYKYDIQDILAKLVTYNDLSPKVYKKFKKQFLNEGKIELKRAIGKSQQKKNKNRYGYYRDYKTSDNLNKFVNLLYPFRKDKKVQEFLNNVRKLEDPDVQMNFIELKLLNKESVDKSVVQKLAEEEDEHYKIYSLLRRYEALDLMEDSLKNITALAEGFLKKGRYYSTTVDTVYYMKSEMIDISGVSHKVYFFMKKTTTESYYDNEKKQKRTIVAMTWNPKDIKENYISPDNYFKVDHQMDDDEKEDEVISDLKKQIQLRDRRRINGGSSYYSGGF